MSGGVAVAVLVALAGLAGLAAVVFVEVGFAVLDAVAPVCLVAFLVRLVVEDEAVPLPDEELGALVAGAEEVAGAAEAAGAELDAEVEELYPAKALTRCGMTPGSCKSTFS